MAIAMADPKLRSAETLSELIDGLEPMIADLEGRLNLREELQIRQVELVRAANEVTQWQDISALSNDILPGPVRSAHLTNIDPAEHSANSYPFSDLTGGTTSLAGRASEVAGRIEADGF
jgi:hypothetical protein